MHHLDFSIPPKELIARLIRKYGSLLEASKRSGIDRGTLRRIKHGHTIAPHVRTTGRILKALNR